MRFVSLSCILLLLLLGFADTALAKNPKTTEPNWRWNSFGRAIVPEQEPNDTCPGQWINCSDTVDPACICNGGGPDYDWYTFSTDAGAIMTIATFGSTDCSYGAEVYDTYLELYSSDCVTLLAYDDDSGPGYYSLINGYTAPYTGIYNLRVRAYAPSEQGCYSISFNVCGIPPFGACCLPGGVCQYMSQIDCGNGGGAFQGPNTSCDPNPCPQPPANDVCSGAIVLERCTAGSLSGDTAPYTNNYDPGSGGCTGGYPEVGNDAAYVFDLNAGDVVDMTYTQVNLDGAFYMVTDCSNVPGTCVVGADDTVTGQPETIHYVVPATGTYYLILDSYTFGGGPWTLDYNFSCPPPEACCFADGHCQMQLPNDCSAMGGTPQGSGTTCSPNPCGTTPTKSVTWGQIKGSYH